jgi:hypothetical protein
MDEELFRKKLSEVADWHIPTISDGGNIKPKNKRGRKTNEELYQQQHEEVFLELFNGKNPTVGPVVTKIHCQPTVCQDCDKICPNGRRKEIKFHKATRKEKAHWRQKCLTCGLQKNPFTGDFDCNSQKAATYWYAWLHNKTPNRFFKLPKEPPPEPTASNYVEKVIESDQETITFYSGRDYPT